MSGDEATDACDTQETEEQRQRQEKVAGTGGKARHSK